MQKFIKFRCLKIKFIKLSCLKMNNHLGRVYPSHFM